MEAAAVLAQCEADGVILEADGDKLRFRPKAKVSPDLLVQLRATKTELLEILRAPWPAECLDSERRFGQPWARLYPLLGKTVETPLGSGRLVQVFEARVSVLLNSRPEVVSFFEWWAVGVCAGGATKVNEAKGPL